MSSFVPERRICLEFYCTITQNSFVKIYDNYAPSKTTCRDLFRRFENIDIDVEDTERSGALKKFEKRDLDG